MQVCLHHRAIATLGFAMALVLFGSSAAIPQGHSRTPDLSGRYNVSGTNPDGAEYAGTLEVIARGSMYQFRWNAGSQYEGVGVRNGRVVAVAFASGSDGTGCGVVDYTILNNGTLEGKWGYWGTSSSGTETATR